MRRSLLRAVILVAMTSLVAASPAAAFPHRRPGFLAGIDACPVTRPNNITPQGERHGPLVGDFADETLWTNLWMWGEAEVPVDEAHRNAAGEAEDMKWAWYRFEPGRLEIQGRRLDGDALPLRARIPEGYGPTGFQVSGITFPSPGCWQVTGRLLDGADSTREVGRLTFVVRVVYLDE